MIPHREGRDPLPETRARLEFLLQQPVPVHDETDAEVSRLCRLLEAAGYVI
jgi:hypothetical protein